MQTVQQLFSSSSTQDRSQSTLMAAVSQCLAAHDPKHRLSLWQKQSCRALLTMPIAAVSAKHAHAQVMVADDTANSWDGELVFINGHWSAASSRLPKGVQISINVVDDAEQSALWLAFLQAMPMTEITAAMAMALAAQVVTITIAADLRLRVVHVLTQPGMHAMQLCIAVQPGCQVVLADYMDSRVDKPAAILCNRQVELADHARFEHGFANALPSHIAWLCTQLVKVARAADYAFSHMATGGTMLRYHHQVHLLAEQAQCTLRGLSLADRSERHDQTLLVKHMASHTYSQQVFKHVAKDHALTNFSSRVWVSPGIRDIQSSQENHNLLLDHTARALTAPELEIYADEVQCAHGATVGAVDAQAVYYLRARGLSQAEAVALLVSGFMTSALDGFSAPMRARASGIANAYISALPASVPTVSDS